MACVQEGKAVVFILIRQEGTKQQKALRFSLPKPFRKVFSNIPRESCNLDLHKGNEATGEAMTQQGLEP